MEGHGETEFWCWMELGFNFVLHPLETTVSQFQRGRGLARVRVRIRAQEGTKERRGKGPELTQS